MARRAEEASAVVLSRLREFAEPQLAANSRWFFKEPVDLLGVRSPNISVVVKEAYREVKTWSTEDRDALCESLWKTGKLEAGIVAVHLYRRFRRQFGRREFRLFERWTDRYVRNWAHTDGVAAWLLASCIEKDPGLMDRLPAWTRSRNRWKRRAAAVAFLQEAKKGRNTGRILEIAMGLRSETDPMVLKGLGWTLKEAYPPRPEVIVAFLEEWSGAPRLVVRCCGENDGHRPRPPRPAD